MASPENLRAVSCLEWSISSWHRILHCMVLSGTAGRTRCLVLYFSCLSWKINGLTCVTPQGILLYRGNSVYFPWPPWLLVQFLPRTDLAISCTAPMTRNCSFLEFLCFFESEAAGIKSMAAALVCSRQPQLFRWTLKSLNVLEHFEVTVSCAGGVQPRAHSAMWGVRGKGSKVLLAQPGLRSFLVCCQQQNKDGSFQGKVRCH